MTEAPTISDLLTRVEGLTGPDREVDALVEIFVRVGLKAGWRACADGFVEEGYIRRFESNRVTASLDAALALVERVRPDWYPEVCKNYLGNPPSVPTWSSDLYSPTRRQTFEASAATPALALLVALLKSLAHAE